MAHPLQKIYGQLTQKRGSHMTNFNPSSPKFPQSSRSASAAQRQLERLYRLPHTPGPVETPERSGLLKRIGSLLLQFFTDSQQVRVWTKETKAGTVWYAYDPALQTGVSRVSEDDLRVWLEQRHQGLASLPKHLF